MEKTSGASLRKELSQYRQQQEAATLAMEDAKQVRRKLVTLESVQNVISGEVCPRCFLGDGHHLPQSLFSTEQGDKLL